MTDNKQFKYIEEPLNPTPPFLNDKVDLQEMHSSCLQELTYQQNKRDQLINYYITITGLVATYLFSSDIDYRVRVSIFAALFVIGWIWSTIVIRYKSYKDAYWICCKTISSLFSTDPDKIDKSRIQHTFYCVMQKCYKSIPKNKHDEPSLLKHSIKSLSSAEFLMFLTLALFSGISGALCILFVLLNKNMGFVSYIFPIIFLIAILIIQTLRYNKSCISLYDALRDKSDSSFNKIYEKAWFIHFFL